MPVHNGENYLKEAIDSILAQTFNDFEFLIIDDGSNDRSCHIIESYDDPRIVLVINKENRGTVHVLNQGITLAKGRYIVRMDADDISLPTRLERQVSFMDNHPDIGISGTGMRLIKKGKLKNVRTQPTNDQELKIQLLFSTCFFHPTVIMRTPLAKAHPYPDNLIYTQDYNFWTRLVSATRFANLDEILLYFREHENQTSSRKADLQISNARIIRTAYLKRLKKDVSPEEIVIHNEISENRNDIDLEAAKNWLENIAKTNDTEKVFESEIFKREISRKWWHCCRKSTQYGWITLRVYRSSYLYRFYQPKPLKFLKFLLRCLTTHKKLNHQAR